MTADEGRVAVYLLACALTFGGFVFLVLLLAAAALSGLRDTSSAAQLAQLEDDIAAWRAAHADLCQPSARVTLRDLGYYQSSPHQARASRVASGMGGDHAA